MAAHPRSPFFCHKVGLFILNNTLWAQDGRGKHCVFGDRAEMAKALSQGRQPVPAISGLARKTRSVCLLPDSYLEGVWRPQCGHLQLVAWTVNMVSG